MVAAAGPTQFNAATVTAPANDYFALTPSNSVNEVCAFRGIYVGVGGDIVVVAPDGSTGVTFVAVPQGIILPVMGIRINSTNTTASSLVGLV